MLACEVAKREEKRDAAAPLTHRAHDIVLERRGGHARERRVTSLVKVARDVLGIECGKAREERRVGGQPVERRLAGGSFRSSHRSLLSLAAHPLATPSALLSHRQGEELMRGPCSRRRKAPATPPRGALQADKAW